MPRPCKRQQGGRSSLKVDGKQASCENHFHLALQLLQECVCELRCMHVNLYVCVCVCECVVAMFLIHSVPLRTELSAVKIYSLSLSLQLDCCPERTVCPPSSLPSLTTLPYYHSPLLPACLFVYFLSWAQHFKIHNSQAKHSCQHRVLSTWPTPCSSRHHDKHASLHLSTHIYV